MGIAATLLANSLLKGRIGPLIAGLGLFVVIVVLLRQARKHFNTRRKNRAADTATDEPALTVSELTEQIRGLLEPAFAEVWVQGEVSNLRRRTAGTAIFR
jgi:hypothetical protein